MSASNCGHCGKLTPDGLVCRSCVDQLLDVLADVPDMLNELRLTLSRQTKFSTGGRSTGETPVVFNLAASDVSVEYARMLHRWQAKLADHLNPSSIPANIRTPYRVSEPVRFLNPIAAASWMWSQIKANGIGGWQDAATMIRRLVEIDEKVEHVIDSPVPREYLGECELEDENGEPCGGDVYAGPDDVYGECKRCKGRCDAQAQRLSLLTWLDEQLMTAAEIARMTVWLGLRADRDTVRKRINQWHRRRRVPCVPVCQAHDDGDDPPPEDEDKTTTFRFRDVRTLLEATDRKAAR